MSLSEDIKKRKANSLLSKDIQKRKAELNQPIKEAGKGIVLKVEPKAKPVPIPEIFKSPALGNVKNIPYPNTTLESKPLDSRTKFTNELLEDYEKTFNQPVNQALLGFTNSATLGLQDKAMELAANAGDKLKERITGKPSVTGFLTNKAYQEGQANTQGARTIGNLAGYVVPSTVSAKALKPVTAVATKNIASPIMKNVVEGAIVGAPLDAIQTLVETGDVRKVPKAMLEGAGIGAGIDVLLGALGPAGKAIKKHLIGEALDNIDMKALKDLPVETKAQVVKELPAARDILMLPESTSIQMPPAKPIPAPLKPKADFYGTSGGSVVRNINELSTPPKQPLALPEGIPQKINVGQEMIDRTRRVVNLPDYNNAQRVEAPFQTAKGELKKKQLPPTVNKLSDKLKQQQAKIDLLKQGEYTGTGQKYDFVRQPEPYKPEPSIYDRAKGTREFPFREVRGKTPEIQNAKLEPKADVPKKPTPIDTEIEKLTRSKKMLQFQNDLMTGTKNKTNNSKFIQDIDKQIADLQSKKSSIPDDVIELKSYVKSLEEQQKKGIKIDLQLFAEAKEKLQRLERGFSKNIRTDSYMNDDLRKSFEEKPLSYERLSNKETLQKAEAIYAKGFNTALSEWDRNLNNFRPEDVPLAKMLSNQAIKEGNIDLGRRIISDMAEKLTKAGQFSQAANILRQADPEATAIFIQNNLDKLNRDGAKRFGDKWKNIDLTDDEIKILNDMVNKSEFERDKVLEDIFNRISKRIPVTNMEKFDAWRRMAMLFNPKTHARNIGGNVLMLGLRKYSDAIGAMVEKAAEKAKIIKPGGRTKSVFWKRNKSLIPIVEKAWKDNQKDLLNIGRWDIENLRLLNYEKPIFKTKWLEALNQFSKNTLNWEDAIFFQNAYKDSLGQYMNANKLGKVTEQAHQYAKRRAMEATFKQTNMVASFINRAKAKGGVVGKLTEAAIPFSKTPANIVSSSIDYSPVGLLKLIYSKNKAPAEVIETLSKGMAGTSIAGLGFLLASLGWARSEKSTSKNAEAILNQMGEQPNSIITPIGSYTFDWAQPFAVPFAMGMVMYESVAKKDNVDIEGITEAVAAGGDTIFNMSMLQNIKDLFGGSYGSPTEKIMGLPVAYFEQAFPTLFGQATRSIDPVRRSTYDPNPVKKFGKEILAKTPFASKLLEPKLDVFGKEQKQNSPLEQFFSPGYSKGKSDDEVTKEIARLYKSTNETDILPKVAPYKLTSSGKTIQLTPKEVTEFQRTMGEENYNKILLLINSPKYKKASDDEKSKMLSKIVRDNYDKAKKELLKNKKQLDN